MKKTLIVFILGVFMLASFQPAKKKDDLRQKLIGVWVLKQGMEKEYLRYVRKDSFELNVRGMEFMEDGTAVLYETFGCQMPYPHYRNFYVKWKVKNRQTLSVDRMVPGEPMHKLHIEKAGRRELLVKWIPRKL